MFGSNNNIAIIYATNSGNTWYVAECIQKALNAKKITADVYQAGECDQKIFTRYKRIIIGSCTWNRKARDAKLEEGHLQDQMETLLAACENGVCKGTRFAVFGLGDKDYTYFCRAADYLENFVKRTAGEQVGATLRVNGFPQGQEKMIEKWAGEIAERL